MLKRITVLIIALIEWNTHSRVAHAEPVTNKSASQENINVYAIRKNDFENLVGEIVGVDRNHHVSRWSSDICVAISGLEPAFSNVVASHLSAISTKVGIKTRLDCKEPNVLIIATDHSQALINHIIQIAPRLGHGYDANPNISQNFDWPSDAAISTLRQNRPVRWFYATSIEPADGNMALGRFILVQGGGSMIGSTTNEHITLSVVIVDIPESSGVKWGALADYTAMVVLTHPKLDADFDTYSIMGLFQDPHTKSGEPPRLTAIDWAILKQLYAADPNQDQRDEVAQIRDAAWDTITRR